MTGGATAVTMQQRRIFGTHEPKWQRFITSNGSTGASGTSNASASASTAEQPNVYQRQYSHVYHQRLQQLGPRCWQNIPTQDDDDNKNNNNDETTAAVVVKVSRILELEEDVMSYVVGTLVQQSTEINAMMEDDIVMDGDANENESSSTIIKDLEVVIPGSKCHHDTDVLYLEDDSGRVALSIGKDCCTVYSTSFLTTGVVVAVKGIVSLDGVLQVQAFYPPAPLPQQPAAAAATALPPAADGDNSNCTTTSACAPHLLLVSGLHCASPHSSSLPRDMLLSFLQGRLRHPLAKNVCRVVVAGGSVSPAVPLSSSSSSKKDKNRSSNKSCSSTVDMVEALRELDAWLLRIVVAGCPVDLMPGKSDPTSANWPQRALHHSLVQHTSRLAEQRGGSSSNKSLFYRTPNPYACRIAGQFVVGTDGTNVADLVQRLNYSPSELASSSSSSPELLAMERNIQWAHLCPNGPSSVPTVPHAEKDPMVLEQEQPRLYFAGNCQQFATKMMTLSSAGSNDDASTTTTTTRLVCVPAFSETGQVVLVNLETMDVQVLKFEE